MGKKIHGSFIKSLSATKIIIEAKEIKEKIKINASSFLDEKGHVTLESISNNREWFYGKTIDDFIKILTEHGYTVEIKDSTNKKNGSKAEILRITNVSKERNIAQVQVSPGSKRHGNVPYIKISTIDIGKIKVVDSTEDQYEIDGDETAKIIFRRKK